MILLDMEEQKKVFTKVEQLRPQAEGLNLTVKVVNSKMILPKGRANGNQARQMRLAECLVGDETGMIIFTARNDQGHYCYVQCCSDDKNLPRGLWGTQHQIIKHQQNGKQQQTTSFSKKVTTAAAAVASSTEPNFGEVMIEKTTQLNSEKMQKETEVQKLMEENVRLTTLLDKKEAQLLAMNEQCKLLMWQEVNAMQANMGLEFQRNKERFVFLKWGSNVFHNMLIVPPGSGIVHQVWHLASDSGNFQVNLEYLGWVIFYKNGILYPDSVVGIDSHTNMIAGLGVVGWGVGGIESE
ncbi:unnamed protein product [Camellia sinensis]